ncbi:uncharacterized protein MICPUCDRAFT_49335 [Micromonas pusilla CCMP1545]|uniref:Predicted protein n=1 Tax=Micromonas pusilla (strain CCMP1545) TaxID=564608 RepID=C1NA88_MICPC|nr:uncharacterized protein MICPUCDRAFT_49335 [Micromonas pusilla CCMP1545]EEH51085.1 predicted protein [Micromonas pusilla CCMP1545]|eukprot:XP_003064751.1 predicted protein [Micromonas pusilla CCMP1545]
MPLPRATGGGDGGKGAAGGGSSRFAHSIAFSPDGRRVVCGAMDGTVAVFDVPSRKLLHTLEGHAMPVRGVCFSVDSKTAFTACDDGYVHAYDVETRSLTQSFPGHDAWALSVAASPCGRAVVSCGADGTVKLWDLTQGLGVGGKMAQSVSDVSDATWGACFKPGTGGGGGGRLAAVGDDASVCLYDFTA